MTKIGAILHWRFSKHLLKISNKVALVINTHRRNHLLHTQRCGCEEVGC